MSGIPPSGDLMHEIDEASDPFRVTRRTILQGGAAALGLLLLGPKPSWADGPVLTFSPIGSTYDDLLHLPDGYAWKVIHAWGDPIEPTGPAYDPTAKGSAADQALQVGMHHDGMHLFPVAESPGHYLLVVNHEYTDEGILHADGHETWTAEKLAKSKNAHGVSITEIAPGPDGRFQVVASRRARRITADTEMALSGEGAKRVGTKVRGTVANCAAGQTPWGTYLTCEENFHTYFVRREGKPTATEKRYGIHDGQGYRWEEHDERFLVDANPTECEKFGWVVEIDPYSRDSVPVKRTALGRFRHENAFVRSVVGQPVAVYLGDDEEGEHLYKFVSKRALSVDSAANRDLLDEGTLYVAKLDATGRGTWIPLVHGQGGLVAPKFPDPASVLVYARMAATEVGATPMDRPEWVAMSPAGRVFVNLTKGPKNVYGHILALDEDGNRGDATAFSHEVFAKGGQHFEVKGSTTNDAHPALGCPDGLFCDSRGVLWIETDVTTATIDAGSYKGFGSNQMVAIDPVTREAKRFLVGPKNCEVTGIAFTPDLGVLFVNLQHPGEPPPQPKKQSQSAWKEPGKFGSWPSCDGTSRPRSATIAIWRTDGKPVGA